MVQSGIVNNIQLISNRLINVQDVHQIVINVPMPTLVISVLSELIPRQELASHVLVIPYHNRDTAYLSLLVRVVILVKVMFAILVLQVVKIIILPGFQKVGNGCQICGVVINGCATCSVINSN